MSFKIIGELLNLAFYEQEVKEIYENGTNSSSINDNLVLLVKYFVPPPTRKTRTTE